MERKKCLFFFSSHLTVFDIEFSANLRTLFYDLFHIFHPACNSWWLYAVTVGGIEKPTRGIWSVVMLG
jgi:hypothetical protein